jgi:hypothetical protein
LTRGIIFVEVSFTMYHCASLARRSLRRRSRGQALTEYATLIAFVSVLVALAFFIYNR